MNPFQSRKKSQFLQMSLYFSEFKYLFFMLVLIFHFNSLSQTTLNFPKFNELKKITLGPDDQLDPSYFEKNNLLLFTHRVNLISHLKVQDLKTGAVKNLFSENFDTFQGKFNPNGKVVFVSFKDNAKGDICFTPNSIDFTTLPQSFDDITCIKRNLNQTHAERSQPFWISEHEIGFIESSNPNDNQIVLYHLKNQSSYALPHKPNLISPSAQYNGNFIVLNQIKGTQSHIVIYDFKNKKNYFLSPLLPGQPGITFIDEKGTSIYFSQYMGDSNSDSIIDGHDNSVVWRISLEEALRFSKNDESSPHQLNQIPLPIQHSPFEPMTPMDFNCSFPISSSKLIYLTCAFEESLDIYSLPLDGFVPKSWNLETIKNALMTARTYQDRILLINTLKSRTLSQEKLLQLNKRLFFLHIQAEEYKAANYYVSSLPREDQKILQSYIKMKLLKNIQSTKVHSINFKNQINNELRLLSSNQSFLSEETKILNELMIQHLRASIKILNSHNGTRIIKNLELKLSNQNNPFLHWLHFKLYEELFQKDLHHLNQWNNIYLKMIQNKFFSLETKIYYTLSFINLIESVFSESTDPIKDRIQYLTQILSKNKFSNEINDLFLSEIISLNLITKKAQSDQMEELKKIDKLLLFYKNMDRKNNPSSVSKRNPFYFIRKAINMRTILNFLKYQKLSEMGIMASNWIRDTQSTNTEFFYARNVVLSAIKEQAYGYWGLQNPRLSSDYFFQSLSLTDDLESYSGYFETMKEINQIENRNIRLDYLKKKDVMLDGIPFIRALLTIDEFQTSSNPIKTLDQSIEILDQMRSDLVDPMPLLLKGYLYLEKFLVTKNGVEYDREAWEKAHHSLVLAYDLSQGRRRIRAAALTNLGLLHLWVNNYAQSIRYWELRKKLSFEEPNMNQERLALTWFYSQALFLNSEPQKAITEILSLPPQSLNPEFYERLAFYNAINNTPIEADKYYNQLIQIYGSRFEKILEPSRTKIRLTYAYNLKNLKKNEESKIQFESLLKDLSLIKENTSLSFFQQLNFESKSIEILLLGFLSQLETDPLHQVSYLEKRQTLIKEDLSLSIQTQLQLAEKLAFINPVQSKESMLKALKQLDLFEQDNGLLGNIIFITLKNYMIHVFLYPNLYEKNNHTAFEAIFHKTLNTLKRQEMYSPPKVLLEQLKLEILWNCFNDRFLKNQNSMDKKIELNKSEIEKKITKIDDTLINEFKSTLGLLKCEF